MSGICKRGNCWRAYIRRQGYSQQNRSFDTRAEAEAWARGIECEMGRGIFVDRIEAELNTFGDLLKRDAKEVSPHKKGVAREILRIRKLRTQSLAECKVAALTSKVMTVPSRE